MADLGVTGESVPLVGGGRRTETGTRLTRVLHWLAHVAVAGAIPSLRPLSWRSTDRRSTTSTTACLLLEMGPTVILRLLVVLNLWRLRLAILGLGTRTGCATTP